MARAELSEYYTLSVMGFEGDQLLKDHLNSCHKIGGEQNDTTTLLHSQNQGEIRDDQKEILTSSPHIKELIEINTPTGVIRSIEEQNLHSDIPSDNVQIKTECNAYAMGLAGNQGPKDYFNSFHKAEGEQTIYHDQTIFMHQKNEEFITEDRKEKEETISQGIQDLMEINTCTNLTRPDGEHNLQSDILSDNVQTKIKCESKCNIHVTGFECDQHLKDHLFPCHKSVVDRNDTTTFIHSDNKGEITDDKKCKKEMLAISPHIQELMEINTLPGVTRLIEKPDRNYDILTENIKTKTEHECDKYAMGLEDDQGSKDSLNSCHKAEGEQNISDDTGTLTQQENDIEMTKDEKRKDETLIISYGIQELIEINTSTDVSRATEQQVLCFDVPSQNVTGKTSTEMQNLYLKKLVLLNDLAQHFDSHTEEEIGQSKLCVIQERNTGYQNRKRRNSQDEPHTGQPHKAKKEPSVLSETLIEINEQRECLTQWQCSVCMAPFGNATDLKTHELMHKDRNSNKYDDVSQSSTLKRNLSLTMATDEKVHTCDVCEKEFPQGSELKEHMLLHTFQEKPFKCDVCQKSFTANKGLTLHMLIHTGEKPHTCDVCQRKFSRLHYLKSHWRVHTGERPYKCDVCQKSFTTSQTLKYHMFIHTGEKPYLCEMCPEKFGHRRSLKTHMLIHTGERPYICEVCHQGYRTRAHLKTHMLIHSDKMHECNVCKKTFKSSEKLKKHMVWHMDERPHKCDVCQKTFKTAQCLKFHAIVHTGEKAHECDICHKRFTRHWGLTKHKLWHSKENQKKSDALK